MKRLLPFLLLLTTCFTATAQEWQTRIFEYSMPVPSAIEQNIQIRMPFGSYGIESVEGDTIAFRQAGAFIIDIVCTDYPANQNLVKLNAGRLQSVYKRFPFLQNAALREVNCYRQLKGTAKERATGLFHGVVIRYRIAQTSATPKTELEQLDSLIAPTRNRKSARLKSLREEERAPVAYLPSGKRRGVAANGKPDYYDPSMSFDGKRITYIIGDTTWLNSHFNMPDSVPVLDFKSARKKGLISKTVEQRFKDQPGGYITLYQPLPEKPAPVVQEEYTDTLALPDPKLPDSTVVRVLARNHWNNTAVVGDVTASMYPYTAQLLVWLQLHAMESVTRDYVFLTDGDDTPDEKKRAGRTGGIYAKRCADYKEVEALVKQTMQKGTGGDIPENVGEALMQTERKTPLSISTVLIADNWAPVRDKQLVQYLHRPVHIILCGVYKNRINTDYLDIAYATNGSIHLMEKDITDWSEVKKGSIIEIAGKKYQLTDGKFMLID